MRTLDPILQTAMDSGNYEPVIKAVGYHGGTESDLQVINYTLENSHLKIKFYTSNEPPEVSKIKITRGAIINSVEYTVTSNWFTVEEFYTEADITTAECYLLLSTFLSTSGNVSYQSLITTAATGWTPSFDASSAWKSYKFFPAGKSLITNNRRNSLQSLLKQKYIVFYIDNDTDVRFFCALHRDQGAVSYSLNITKADRWSGEDDKTDPKYFLSRDEAGTIHTTGTTERIHNLGYLESTDAAPYSGNFYTSYPNMKITAQVNLKYQTGDKVTLYDPYGGEWTTVINVKEVFDPSLSSMQWRMEITSLIFSDNTEGGAMPSTIERVAAYTPLVTTGFNNNLDSTVNNLQALAEAVDDLTPTLIDGSVTTAKIANNAVTFGKMQAITDGKLLGASGGTAVEEISVGSALSLSGNTLDAVTTIDTHKVSKLRESDDGADALTASASGNLTAALDLSVLNGATYLRQLIGKKNDNMADDTAVVMPTMATGNRFLFGIVCNDGEYFFGVDTYNSIATIAASANFNIVASDGAALAGNGGTDGKWNIKDWNGALYLNNRRGGTANAGFTAFGSD